MYGMKGSAIGHAAPARGRMHRVIIEAEHAGHSVVDDGSWMSVPQ
jgi:hypothetical protein